ncbi:MAG TPA: TonB-dependent receptor [Allosphingosinicella sp.]|jgi:vitamin B12 transporter|uniref:TonB-dependent receptor plug domain-containing protein n=1 Tax=Allosphingosinicella sp. TaxID=2823234 RepID=UPI002F2A3155
MFPLLFLAAAAPPASVGPEIVVTASREPVAVEDTAVSASLFDREAIEALALPMTSDLLRLSPGLSVATTGPRGSQTQVRIRGAEANHTLLFLDGIRFNDPAAGNEARFELLTSDLLSRVEIVRGPQSALWGSEALGGVVAVETSDPGQRNALSALGEYGGLDSSRASGQFAVQTGPVGLSGSAGFIRSYGIDSFGSGGERDGFENKAGSLKAVFRPSPGGELGLVGHYVEGSSEFDGFDPVSFRRVDTLDETENRIAAVRSWGKIENNGWSLMIDGSYLSSANRNRLGEEPLNRTFGERFTLGAQLSKEWALAGGRHRFTAAAEHEGEEFRARDQSFFGGTDQDRARDLTALVGEWRADWSDRFATDLAVRHDRFSAFDDATTFRAAVLFRPVERITLHGAYGEGIAQPTFYDLFGFFPGSFLGNPELRPESSKGFEAGLRWRSQRASLGVTGFSNRLRDEIIGTFDPATFISSAANASGRSRRRGVELEGAYRFEPMRLSFNYTYLDANERSAEGDLAVREVRRPRHSANLFADGQVGPIQFGAALSYVGERKDTDFDVFPAQLVTLDDYLLASLKLGYRITERIEAYARVENAFDAGYQDVIGYNTPGRTVYAGLRLRLGR